MIGGGAGGMAAARAAARRGARTLLVQHGRIGGDCTFTGCVPSKALIAAAARGDHFADAMASVARAVEAVAATEDDHVLEGEGVAVLHGWARFRADRRLDVDGRVVAAPRYVIATGAGPAIPPIDGLADADPLTNETVFELGSRPERLAVLGGGPIGCELAQAFARLGSAVTVVEADERLLTKEEPEASAVIAAALADDGVDVRTAARLDRVEGRSLHLAGGDVVEADRILVAVGRRAGTGDLGLDAVGVETERGFVRTDDTLATTAKDIWAVGDVAGRLQLTHAADEMGRLAAGNALRRVGSRRFRSSWIPWATFTDPEVGRVGMTEAESADHGGRVAYLPMTEVDRAVAVGATRGFVKLLAGPRTVLRNAGGGRVLGATVVAERGGEMVHEAALAMRTRMFAGRLAQAVHAYPTWSVALQQAAAQLFIEVGGRTVRPARPARS